MGASARHVHGAGQMTPTDHEKLEWARLAQDAYKHGHSAIGTRFSGSAARLRRGESMPVAEYDALMADYRAWLIDGVFPGVKKNSPLVIFNPRRGARRNADLAPTGEKIESESQAWYHIFQDCAMGLRSLPARPTATERMLSTRLTRMQDVASRMLQQLTNGIHRNPQPYPESHPIRNRVKLSGHVQALAYVHEKDGERYVHGFGNCDPDEADLARGLLKLNDLKTTTHVAMYGNPDGSITLVGTKGQPLAALFD